MKKIIIISSFTESLITFRYDLLVFLRREGFEVYALGPTEDKVVVELLESIHVKFYSYHLERNGFNPFDDLKTIKSLREIFKEIKPDFILPYTVKPVIYSNIAKKGLSIKSINWITGVGFYGNDSKNLKERFVKYIMTIQYRFALSSSDPIVFQNEDDLMLFRKKRIRKEKNVYITPGSGINLDRFTHTVSPINPITFIFVARLIREKGLDVFIEAAKDIKIKFPDTEFIIVGGLDITNPNSISQEEIDQLRTLNGLQFTGKVKNVIDYVSAASVFVLPSMYREGVPRSILEALSIGRPIITTNNVGCKDTVVKGYNGILVEKNSVSDLVDAMMFFCEKPEKIIEYGYHSRKLALEKFDVKIVNKIIKEAITNV